MQHGSVTLSAPECSGGTLCNAAEALTRVTSSKLKELVITDSIQPTEAVKIARNVRVIPIASLLGEAIGRTSREESVSSLFE